MLSFIFFNHWTEVWALTWNVSQSNRRQSLFSASYVVHRSFLLKSRVTETKKPILFYDAKWGEQKHAYIYMTGSNPSCITKLELLRMYSLNISPCERFLWKDILWICYQVPSLYGFSLPWDTHESYLLYVIWMSCHCYILSLGLLIDSIFQLSSFHVISINSVFIPCYICWACLCYMI